MRIKSYFAPSVQSAISIARKEFGDDVTLVTSHTAALESRHLGDYEVVFAVEEPAGTPEPVQPKPVQTEAPAQFQDLLQQAIATPLSTEENPEENLDRVRSLLVEMGIDAAMVRALMTMIERCVAVTPPAAEPVVEETPVESAPEAEAVAPQMVTSAGPDLTPAELAFYLSVSVGA